MLLPTSNHLPRGIIPNVSTVHTDGKPGYLRLRLTCLNLEKYSLTMLAL